MMAKATARRVILKLAPSDSCAPRPPARSPTAQLIYALDLSHHVRPPSWRMSARVEVVAFASRSFFTLFAIFFGLRPPQ